MQDADAIQRMKVTFQALEPLMDERLRRQWAAAEANAYGWGGIQAVSQATGLSPNTIRKGGAELAARQKKPRSPVPTRLRRVGGGRKRKTISDPELLEALEALVDPATRGDPESPLPVNSRNKGIQSVPALWADCCGLPATASRATARRRKAARTQIEMPSSSTSTPRSSCFSGAGNQ